jgi:hypothetical protein
LPTPPIKINKLLDINNLPSLVGGADELDEVAEAQGVNKDRSKLSKILNIESSEPKEASSNAVAETLEHQLPTPKATPIQNDYPVNSIKQDIDVTPRLAQANTQYRIPGGWIDSLQRDTTSI